MSFCDYGKIKVMGFRVEEFTEKQLLKDAAFG